MPEIELYSTLACPYCRRTLLVLAEKNIDYTLTEFDLTQKPDWLVKISPYGKVPGLKRGRDLIWESAIINEYLEELYPSPALLPQDPAQRAWVRFWIDYCNVKFAATTYKLTVAQTSEQIQIHSAELRKQLLFIETKALAHGQGGPYWLGQEFSLADVGFYPFVERFCVIERHHGFRIPDECTKFRAWLEAMRARPSVQATKVADEIYFKIYAKYAPQKPVA